MIVLVDYNLNNEAIIFSGSIALRRWLYIVAIELVTFADVGLPADSEDRIVWRFAQANQMLLLTANRNAKGEDSLERVAQRSVCVKKIRQPHCQLSRLAHSVAIIGIWLSRILCGKTFRNCL